MCRASLASRAFGLAVALVVAGSATAQAEPTARAEIPTLWLGAALTQDMPFVSGDDVCSKQQQLEGGFTCFRASGSQYHGTPVPGQNDRLNPGFVVGTTRVELGVDYALGDPVTLGARVGYVLRGGGPDQLGGGFAITRSWFGLACGNVATVGFAVDLPAVAVAGIVVWTLDTGVRALRVRLGARIERDTAQGGRDKTKGTSG